MIFVQPDIAIYSSIHMMDGLGVLAYTLDNIASICVLGFVRLIHALHLELIRENNVS